MRIVQIQYQDKIVACTVDGDMLSIISGEKPLYDVAMESLEKTMPLATLIAHLGSCHKVSYDQSLNEGVVVTPLHHPTDDAHMLVTGTGLTHLGSADARNNMHVGNVTHETDSMRMFRWGVQGGKPADGQIGVQPEWFYKGDGACVVAPYTPLVLPNYADDGGEEPEIVGLYINDKNGIPHRLGFAMSNEYSDHVMEKRNYLYLAHSKLRQCSFGPELVLGDLPTHIEGKNTIYRNGEVLWTKPFLSGEDNMSHTIANLEQHHFKYDIFCRPGDINMHFFGTATVSFADDIMLQHGDVMEITCDYFGKPLRNRLKQDTLPKTCLQIKNL